LIHQYKPTALSDFYVICFDRRHTFVSRYYDFAIKIMFLYADVPLVGQPIY